MSLPTAKVRIPSRSYGPRIARQDSKDEGCGDKSGTIRSPHHSLHLLYVIRHRMFRFVEPLTDLPQALALGKARQDVAFQSADASLTALSHTFRPSS